MREVYEILANSSDKEKPMMGSAILLMLQDLGWTIYHAESGRVKSFKYADDGPIKNIQGRVWEWSHIVLMYNLAYHILHNEEMSRMAELKAAEEEAKAKYERNTKSRPVGILEDAAGNLEPGTAVRAVERLDSKRSDPRDELLAASDHYKRIDPTYDPIAVMNAWGHTDFFLGNAVKYLGRVNFIENPSLEERLKTLRKVIDYVGLACKDIEKELSNRDSAMANHIKSMSTETGRFSMEAPNIANSPKAYSASEGAHGYVVEVRTEGKDRFETIFKLTDIVLGAAEQFDAPGADTDHIIGPIHEYASLREQRRQLVKKLIAVNDALNQKVRF